MITGIDIQELEKISTQAAPSAMADGMSLSYQTRQLTDLPLLEEALESGLLASWEELLAADPTATLFQGPSWSLTWYRTYFERYQPCVLLVTYGSQLVGLIPLAVERNTNTLVFASSNMSDYRDVIALPQHKKTVVVQLINFYHSFSFQRQPLWLGPNLPESNTATLALEVCKEMRGVYAIPRSHPGWRWWPIDNSAEEFLKKKSVRQAIKHYQRQGGLQLERIETFESWQNFKQEFFDQHSLRQLYVSRPVSFNDRMKQAFYETLIREHSETVHAVALRVAGRIVAAHYGPVRDGVLYWGAPAFDIHEARYSPGLVLLALIIQDAERLGLRGIDLTIGVEEYKRRFSNSCVDLPSVELYGGHGRYYTQVARDAVVNSAKRLIAKSRGQEAWDPTKAQLEKWAARTQRIRELGVTGSLARITRRSLNVVGERTRWLTLIATPADLKPAQPVLAPDETCTFGTDELRDLLRWEGPPSETSREISVRVRNGPDEMRKGRTLHTVLVNGKLACWGWSYWPKGPEIIDVIQDEIAFTPNSVSLYDFYTVPEFRGRRLYQALLTHILHSRFAEGAERAYIMVREKNIASRKAIERVGFRLAGVDKIIRVLRWRKLVRSQSETEKTGEQSSGPKNEAGG
jgi:CelD/BcsL family acetyltransferase involved in cellulose biosynthesis/GNAT superfamily N-acetyltransferase